ncbi:MAG: hypothetical protein JO038_05795 [Alphaproteobacteria bacterium]|nr:hypothetical protein [Alphaproteobacteria bacterium]
MIRAAVIFASLFWISTCYAQQKAIFTVAKRDQSSITSIEFYCLVQGESMDCAFARTRISRKATEEREDVIKGLKNEQLLELFAQFTNQGKLCGEDTSDTAITERVLGSWGRLAAESLLLKHASAWRQMCAERTEDATRKYMIARYMIDAVSCLVSTDLERATFHFNNGRWINVDQNAGILCPGTIITEILEKHGLVWTYEYVENVNRGSGGICSNMVSVNEKYDFASWAEPAPFTCQTIEFSTF